MNVLLGFLRSLFLRDGLASIGKVVRYGFSPKAWRWLLTNARNQRLVRASGLVDEEWYRREYPEVAEKRIDPVQDFLTFPPDRHRLPNPDFVPDEYLAVNLDVKASRMTPAVHYVTNGIREKRPVSTLENYERPFPQGAVELRREFPAAPARCRRTAIFAAFSGDGRLKDTVLYYLKGLREVADNIVFVANCPIFPDEVAKLDGLVRLAVFQHHGCYDFGSYKIGWNEAKALGLLEPDVCDELVVCNDSCYGPVFPFTELFQKMADRWKEAERPADFWGMSLVCQYGRRMIPSYFYVFGPAVLEGSELDRWFDRMEPCGNRGQVVLRCESVLTQYLESSDYVSDAIVPKSFQSEHKATPIKFPLSTMRDFRDPLVKIKALKGDSLEDLDEVRAFLASNNPELAAMIPVFPTGGSPVGMDLARNARLDHRTRLVETANEVRDRVAATQTLRILLLSLDGEERWLRQGFDGAAVPPRCETTVAAIPDFRVPEKSGRLAKMRAARKKIMSEGQTARVLNVRTDNDGEWLYVAPTDDVVVYPSADDVSDFHYNPHFSVGRNFLPVFLFDRRAVGPLPLEKEFARQNYAYFWKVFFDDRAAFELYAKHSLCKGENAVFCGAEEVGDRIVRLLRDRSE